MKEILEELARKTTNFHNDQVYYKYDEKEMIVDVGIERHLFILEMSKYSNEIKRVIFKKSYIQTHEGINSTRVNIDFFELLRKEFLLEVFRYGVLSSVSVLDKLTNDKTRNS